MKELALKVILEYIANVDEQTDIDVTIIDMPPSAAGHLADAIASVGLRVYADRVEILHTVETDEDKKAASAIITHFLNRGWLGGGRLLVNFDADHTQVALPKECHTEEGVAVLNIASAAINDLVMDAESMAFNTRFNGTARRVVIPFDAIYSIRSVDDPNSSGNYLVRTLIPSIVIEGSIPGQDKTDKNKISEDKRPKNGFVPRIVK